MPASMISAAVGLMPKVKRHQHGDGGDGTDARKHADRRADHDTDQAVQQIDGGERDGEPHAEVLQEIGHAVLRARGDREAEGP